MNPQLIEQIKNVKPLSNHYVHFSSKQYELLSESEKRIRLINKNACVKCLNPTKFEQESNTWLEEIKSKLQEYKSTEGALPTLSSTEIKVNKVDAIKHSPLPKWLEGLTKNYLQTKGIVYHNLIDGIRFKFPGHKESLYTFNIRESVNNPIPEPISLQHEIIQSILKEAIPYTTSQQAPKVKIKQGNTTAGYWSLWHLEVKNQFEISQVIHIEFVAA
jgi:hypothetical protein